MRTYRIFRSLLLAAVIASGTLSAGAVTDKEMEQARTIAAKAYLRFANDGSGYLDDVKATSMTELRKSLKKKEVENLAAFTAIKTPSDYASWDKDKLISYWVSVLDNKTLLDKGKAAKGRIRKQIGAMTVTAAAVEPAKEAGPAPEEKPAEEPVLSDQAADLPAEAAPADAVEGQDILADQKAVAEDAVTPTLEKESNSTWVYILILCLLLGVVVWLVAYAARLMKKQEPAAAIAGGNGDAEAVRESMRQALATQQEKLVREQERNAEMSQRLERLKVDNKRLEDQLDTIRLERSRLAEEVAILKEKLGSKNNEPAKHADPEILKVIYLGRTNARGIFVRGDRRVSPGNTIYRLDTDDGQVGTFHVVDQPAVVNMVLEHPAELLGGGCNADFDDAIGATSIVTESNGTAIFENGYWKVLRKSKIRFE